jgi:TonB-linked SusC/RagA family outer membrane protein
MKKISLVLSLVLFAFGFALAQRTVTGTISDQKGEPMVGASVLVKGTTTGVVSDIDGKYSLNLPAGATTLVFSFAGYVTQEVTTSASNVIDVSLSESTLQEVVVTAIGIQREKKALGYSATDLKADDVTQRSESDPLRALQGKVPGVSITGGGGAPGQSTKMNIRGFSSLTGNTQPLFVVDGIPFDNSVNASTDANAGTQFSNRAFDIDPNNIESMTVLKGAAASALYGSRATNGVVVITTKTGKKNRKGLEVSYNGSYSLEEISRTPNYQDMYTQGSSQNYNGGFIGNWGAPFPSEVDRINQEFYNGEARYINSYGTWGPSANLQPYPTGTGPHPIVGLAFTEPRFSGAFPEYFEEVEFNGTKYKRAKAIPIQPYNFVKDFFEKGLLAENSLTFNAGGDNTGLSATLSRMDNKGMLPNSAANRTSVSFGGNAKLANGFIISGAVTYVNTYQKTPPVAPSFFTDYGTQGDASIFSRLFYLPRNYNLLEYPFEVPGTGDNVFYRALDNPLWLAKYSRYQSNVNRAYGNIAISYEVAPWLNLMVKGGINTYNDARKNVTRAGGVFDPNGRVWTNDINNTELDITYLATLNRKVTDDLDARLILGFNQNQRSYTDKFIDGDGMIFRPTTPDEVENFGLQNVTTQIVRTDLRRKQRFYAGFADLQLSYKNFLYLGIVGRNDVTSTLLRPDGTGNNSYFYPGLNASFAFTDAFKLNNNILSFGKLRAAWAQVGNEASPYRTATYYGINQPFVTAGGTRVNRATLSDRLGNSDLVNELTTEIEFGTDLRFFNNRIGIDFTWFKRNSTNQITSAAVAPSTGYETRVINAGEIQNKGIEAQLNISPIKTASGFNWDATINFTQIRSLIVSAGDAPEIFVGGGLSSLGTIHRTGFPYGMILGSRNTRVTNNEDFDTYDQYKAWQASKSSNPVLIDKSTGLPFITPVPDIIGDPNPDFIMGFRNTFSYKGLSLMTLLDWRQGGDMYSVTAASLILRGQLGFQTIREGTRVVPGVYGDPATGEADLLDGKTVKNTTGINAFDSHFTDGYGAYGADETNVYDATTIRLREVVLAYELPKKLLKKTPLGSIRLSLSARNLWFYTPNMVQDLNLDPEVLSETASSNVQGFDFGATPTTRRWGVNVSVTF